MTSLLLLVLLAAQPLPSSLEQVRGEVNPEHRARLAIDYAGVAEKNAETAYASGDLGTTVADLKDVGESMQLAQDSFVASHKTPGRNPGPFKYAEMRSRELLIRLSDLERRMDLDERGQIAGIETKVREIHDAWFEGIMGRAK
jgi:hypothetical protein